MVKYPLWVQKLIPPTKKEVNAFARVHVFLINTHITALWTCEPLKMASLFGSPSS